MKAIIIGGTNDHICLIEKLKNRGYSTILIDYLDNPPAKTIADIHIKESILEKETILKISEKEKPDLVVAACIDQAIPSMAYVSEKLGLNCHLSYETALSLTNKALMKEIFLNNQIPTSRYIVIDDISKADLTVFCFPIVVKPADSNSSKGVEKVNSEPELKSAFGRAMSFSKSGKVIIEEFKHGEEYSVDVIIRDHEPEILMITKNKKIKQNYKNFTIIQNVYDFDAEKRVKEIIKEIARKISKAFNLNNVPLLIQLLVDGNDIWVLEFSSRIGGGSKCHFIKRIAGFDIIDYYLDSIFKNDSNAAAQPRHTVAAAMNYIYAIPGIFNELVNIESLKDHGIVEQYFLYKSKGMRINGHLSSTDRPAGFMVIADNMDKLKEKVKYADKEIIVLNENNDDIMLHGLYDDL